MAFALILALSFASCANPDKVHFQGVESVSMKSLSAMELTARVDNRSCHNINVQRGQLVLKDRGNEVAQIVLAQKVVIARRSDQSVVLPFNLSISNALSLLSLPKKIKNASDDITVSGSVTVKGGLLKKNYTIEQMTLPQFLSQIGISGGDVTKYIGL